VEEREYKATYQALNQRRCVFEKAINSRSCNCAQAARFCLADREGVACKSETDNRICIALLDELRRNARFSLHVTRAEGPLPHAKEIRVQTGGLLGLQILLYPETAGVEKVADICRLTRESLARYGTLASLPYERIVQAIVSFRGRPKRTRPVK
jgi:hypothetical protein